MFIYSVRASSLKFFLVILLTLSLLIGILIVTGEERAVSASSDAVSFENIKTNEERIAFINKAGYEVGESELDKKEFTVPRDFDLIINGYNEIQKRQGLDISKYKNKKVTRYTYEVKSYDGYSGKVYANLVIYKGRVIACDLSSASPDGFVKPLVT